MTTTKTTRIIYWITTSIIFLMEGVMPALTSQTELAKEGIKHLGYPEYFGNALVVFKVLGALILIIPKIPKRLKEWAYAGFIFDFIFASISHFKVDGVNFQSIFPLIFLAILLISYYAYNSIYFKPNQMTSDVSKK
ncbi:DoxX family protein [Robertkochia solimangrovi]|uniref:DoxX family protein n=1 Tax=Robertkochia solimangrovi TaxID=2213046 RepID=UPI00117E5448|nr:DoxX family protein [Robertkochia solimangrovi]TRZ45100.1 DoxX family protein [Robertkochia solimangrovi]